MKKLLSLALVAFVAAFIAGCEKPADQKAVDAVNTATNK